MTGTDQHVKSTCARMIRWLGAMILLLPAVVAAQPVLMSVEAVADGYALNGRGFGADRTRLEVFEGMTKVMPAAIVAHTDARVVVRSRLSGPVQHRIVVAGAASATVTFVHRAPAAVAAPPKSSAIDPAQRSIPSGTSSPGRVAAPAGTMAASTPAGAVTSGRDTSRPADAKPAASGSRTTVAKRLSLGTLSAAGHKAQSAVARRASLGSLSATGHKEQAPPARRLSLGSLTAQGWRQ